MPTFPWKASRILESLLLGVAVFLTLVPFLDASVFTIFQARDLSRAAAVANGSLYLWGPETTGGGNLPGGFYYWLISIPYWFSWGWSGVWYLMAALDSVAVVVLWNFLRGYGVASAAFGVLFYVSSPVRVNMFKLFWNPSFLPLFVMIAVVGLLRSYSSDKPARWVWPLSAAMIGLAIQIHFSAAPLILAAIVMQVAGPSVGVNRLPWRTWWAGVLTLVAIVTPYLIWFVARKWGVTIGEAPPNTAGRLSDSFLAVVNNPAGRFVLDADWIMFFKRALMVTWQLVPWPAWVAVLLTLLFLNPELRRIRPRKLHSVLAVCLICSLSSTFLFYYLPFGARYAYVFTLMIPILLATFAEDWIRSIPKIPLGVVVPVLTAVISLLFATRMGISKEDAPSYIAAFAAMMSMAALVYREFRTTPARVLPAVAALLAAPFAMFYGSPGRQIVGKVPTVAESIEASQFIHSRTGWNFEEVRRKTHLYMFHRESDLEEIYNTTTRDLRIAPTQTQIDGFLAAITNESPGSLTEAKRIFVNSQGASEIQSMLTDGKMELTEFIVANRLLIASFIWRDHQHGLETIHNIGYSLGPSPEDKLLQSLTSSAGEEARKVSDSTYVFQWNECEGQPDFGRAAVIVENRDGVLRTTIAGQTLSKPSPWTIPYCTQGWVKPFVEVFCGKKKYMFNLAKNVGLNWLEPPVAAETFNAPFLRKFKSPCDQISRISAGRETTLTNNNGKLSFSKSKTLILDTQAD